jgi:hypothetical protein
MAAMLSALPVWTGFDPLVVLSREKHEDIDIADSDTEQQREEVAVEGILAAEAPPNDDPGPAATDRS